MSEAFAYLGLAVLAGGIVARELGPEGPKAGRGPTWAPGVKRPGKFFSWGELVKTNTGLPNAPTVEQGRNLVLLTRTLDQVREYVRRPMRVNSAFRSPAVNAKVGGAPNSRHLTGLAADVQVLGLSAEDLSVSTIESGAPFDKLIWYPLTGHLHISVDPDRARKRTLVAVAGGYVERAPVAA